MPYLTPEQRVELLDHPQPAHGDHPRIIDYCRLCDEFYDWCCGRAEHIGHRVYRRADGTLDLTQFAFDTKGA